MKTLVFFPYTVVLMNWAAVVGLYHFLRRQRGAWSGYEVLDPLPKDNQPHQPADRRAAKFSDAA